MAQNYYDSSQYKRWQFTPKSLHTAIRAQLSFFDNSFDHYRLFLSHYLAFITRLGVHLKLRQQVIATAQVYFKRLYLQVLFTQFDPQLIAPALLFIAAKVEECPLNAKAFITALHKLEIEDTKQTLISSSTSGSLNNLISTSYPYTLDDLLTSEYYIIYFLSFDFIIFHPYQSLLTFGNSIIQSNDALQTSSEAASEFVQLAWNVCNDSYHTNLCFFHPPYCVALASLYFASILFDTVAIDYTSWHSAHIEVPLAKIVELAQELNSLYLLRKKYSINPLFKSKEADEFVKKLYDFYALRRIEWKEKEKEKEKEKPSEPILVAEQPLVPHVSTPSITNQAAISNPHSTNLSSTSNTVFAVPEAAPSKKKPKDSSLEPPHKRSRTAK